MRAVLFSLSVGILWIALGPFPLKSILCVILLALRLDRAPPFKYHHYYSFAALLFLGFEFFLFRDDDWYKQWSMLKYTAGFFFFTLSTLMIISGFKPRSFSIFWSLLSLLFLIESQNLNPWFLGFITLILFVFVTYFPLRSTKRTHRAFIVSLLFVIPVSVGFLYVRPHLRWQSNYLQNARSEIGFNRVSDLNSFASLFVDPAKEKIQLRVIGSSDPKHLGAQSYDTYIKGKWKSQGKQSILFPQGAKHNHFNYLSSSLNADTYSHLIFPEYSEKQDWIFTRSPYDQISVISDSLREFNGRYVYPSEVFPTPYYLVAEGKDSTLSYQSQSLLPVQIFDELPFKLKSTPLPLLVKAIDQWFKKDFTYSLDLEKPQNLQTDPIVHFLRSKRGYCEYFASAATLILQAHGFKARYVKGFAHPVQMQKNVWVYTSTKAHAWVEYNDQGQWITWDPTPPGFFPAQLKDPTSFYFNNFLFKFKEIWFYWKNGQWIQSLEELGMSTTVYIPYVLFIALLLLLIYRQKWSAQLRYIDRLILKDQRKDLHNKPLLIQISELEKNRESRRLKRLDKIRTTYLSRRFKN